MRYLYHGKITARTAHHIRGRLGDGIRESLGTVG